MMDLSATVSVRTPGHPDSGHLPGWHLWYRADPACPVRMGPLVRCHAVELRTRGTCPGSPGYVVWSEPDQLPVLPRWMAGLAGPPVLVTSTGTGHGGAGTAARLHGITGRLLAAQRGERNRLLFWASLRMGEMVADGELDAGAAGQALTDAAAMIGLVREDGQRPVAATIRSGFQRVGVAYEPARLPYRREPSHREHHHRAGCSASHRRQLPGSAVSTHRRAILGWADAQRRVPT